MLGKPEGTAASAWPVKGLARAEVLAVAWAEVWAGAVVEVEEVALGGSQSYGSCAAG